MNIVIEGCDGSGKTFLAEFLCKKLGLQYWHESAPRSKQEYEQMLAMDGWVFDRFCLGQFVYNREEERKLTFDELKELLNKTFPARHTILIYVDADSETCVSRMIQRGECPAAQMDDAIKWVKNIRGTYRQLLRETGVEYINIEGRTGVCTTI